MFKNLTPRFALIGVLLALCGWFLYSNHQRTGSIVTLGLDLRGGSYMAIEVEDPTGAMPADRRSELTDQALQIIRARMGEFDVAEPSIAKVGADRIEVELPGLENQARAKEIIQRAAVLRFQLVAPGEQLANVLTRMDRAVVSALGAEAVGADAGRPTGALGGLLGAAPADTAAGADAEAVARPLSSRLIATGSEGQFVVATEDYDAVMRYLALPEVQRLMPRGTEVRPGIVDPQQPQAAAYRTLYLLESRAMMTGEYLTDAQAQRDPQFGRPEVVFELNRRGGRIFERATGENTGRLMAIVLDDRVFSAPVIQSAIGTRGRIELGGAGIEEARDLALVLRAGSLPAPIRIIEERSVGPSLGQDSVDKGFVAGMIGIGLVVLIMLAYYRAAGMLAVAALAGYVVFVLGGLAGMGAALTLPGIAGLVLSIGMAVDANVLIFERIREELIAGRSPRVAVSEGFGHALSAIVDSQLTTLITAFVLFQFGTGPVRGFAITLAIGIIASMFTAIFVTRTFFMLYLDRRPANQAISI
jgi:protein-export membrane protein SecD